MSANVAGIQVGTGYILVTPKLHPDFGNAAGTSLKKELGTAGHAGGTALANGVAASAGSSQTRSRFGRIGNGLGNALGQGITSRTVAMTGALTVAGAVVAKFATKSVNSFKEAATGAVGFSRVAGGTVEDASRLRFAMKELGVPAEQINGLMGKLSKTLDAQSGTLKGSAALTKELGFSVRDAGGQLLPVTELMPKLTKRFAEMPAGAEKTALAMKLFGRGGAQLLPFLNAGPERLAELEHEADKFGATISTKGVADLKKYNRSQKEMKAAQEGLQISIGQHLIPIYASFQQFLAAHVIPIIGKVAHFFEAHSKVIIPVIAGFAALIATLKVYAVVMRLVNLVMNQNPFVRVATLLIALGVALYTAYKHSETFRNIVNAVFRAVAAAGEWMWRNVLKPVFTALQFAWQVVMKAIRLYWDYYAHPVIKTFATVVTWLWRNVLSRTFGAIADAWRGLASGMSWTYDHLIKPIWQAIQDALGGVSAAFKWTVGAVSTAWSTLKDVFSKPIDLTLRVVNTFDRFVNDVLEKVGLHRPLPEHLHLSTGGPVPGGYGGGDRVPILGEPGEVMLRKEAVRSMGGPAAVHARFNRNAHGGQRGTGGSWYDHIPGAGIVKHAVSGAWDAGKWVLSEATHLLRQGAAAALQATVSPVRALLNPLGKSGAGGWIHHAADNTFDKVINWVKGKESSDLSGTFVDAGKWVGGRLAWPVPGFGGISQYFGAHPGIDIPAPWGTPIAAANGGTVTDAGPAQGFGNWVRILGQGLRTVYGHMRADELAVHVGQVVKAGQIIARVGNEGYSTGPHLHFEVHPGGFGGPADPVPYLSGGVPTTVHDKGGWLRPGYAGLNLTGKPEAVLDPEESLALKASLRGGLRRPGLFDGATVHIGDGADLDAAAARHDWEQRRGVLT